MSSSISTAIGKTKELSNDVRDKMIDRCKAEKDYKAILDLEHERKERKVVDEPETTWEKLVNDLKAVGGTVTKNTTGNTLRHNGFKSCKVPLLKKAHVEAHLTFFPLNDSEEDW